MAATHPDRRNIQALLLSCTLQSATILVGASPVVAQVQSWMRQLGSAGEEIAYAANADGSGGVYVGGWTWGSLGGQNAGLEDAWLARYDSSGNRIWLRQLGTSGFETTFALASDGAGGVYAGGMTSDSLGGPSAGRMDAWLARYSSLGNQTWIRQLGTNADDYAYAAAPDLAGGLYLGGTTSGSLGGQNAGGYTDAWLGFYDSSGTQIWVRQLGTIGLDAVYSCSPNSAGGVYIGGATSGDLGASNVGAEDCWLARYDNAGNLLWITQFGTSESDYVRGITPDATGGVYASGYTSGSLAQSNLGLRDAWIARYDADGHQIWICQLGTPSEDLAYALAADGSGGVYVCGSTGGSLGGSGAGDDDGWIAHYNASGAQTWIYQLGTMNMDAISGVASDDRGGLYAAGITRGNLGGQNAGVGDAWVSRYVFAAARATYRNAGSNPSSLSCSLPVLGGSWQAQVDLSTTGHAVAYLNGYYRPAQIALRGGQVLLGKDWNVISAFGPAIPLGGAFRSGPAVGPYASFSLALPLSAMYVGMHITVQAIHVAGTPSIALSNAQDLVLGF